MLEFKFNIDKAIHTLLYISSNVKNVDFHKTFKIIYFAELKHISEYGRPIIGDCFIAMKDGPVPSNIYDILKQLRTNSFFKSDTYSKYFKVVNSNCNIPQIIPQIPPDLDELSESDIECIKESIKANAHLSFDKLSKKSHDNAWDSAKRDNVISNIEIAKAGGASPDMIKYIKSVAENHSFILA